jgi:DNA helicase-2/ATP-dependent DNA helicase PcrA
MHKHRESFTKEQFARRLEYGDEILGNYYDQNINSFHKIVAVEQSLRGVVNGVPIKGKLDKLEFNGKVVQIIDYKTGDPENGGKKINGPTEKDPNGGDYWRQAAFYKILVDQVSGKNWKAQKTIFDFIEPDKKKKFRQHEITTTPEDISTVTAQITESWEKIQAREFYTGCGKKDCEYCNFVKTNDLAIVLHDNNDQEDL